jgi:sigma-B regulation protein RsbU (phosphoserine phosphatase)
MFNSLTTRLIAWSLILTGVVYVTAIGLSNNQGRRTAIRAAEREATNDTDAAGYAVEDVLDAAEESAASLARSVSELQPSREDLARLVRRFSEDNKATVARYLVILETGHDADPPAWYSDARERGAPGWSEPYRDGELNATVITLAAPVRRADGAFMGAAAASVRLDFLSSVVREIHLGASGFALVLTRNGLLVAHSRRDLSRGVHDPLAELAPELRGLVEPVAKRAQSGESGFAALPIDGRVFRLTYRPIGAHTGWTIATAYAEDELFADVSALQRSQIVLAASGLAILALAIVILSRRITRPLAALAASAGRLATGDLDGPLPEAESRDEIGALTAAFRHMRDSLKEYIRNLQETTAAKERLEGEMKAARRIQADMLPSPTAGGASSGYELSAVLVPARAIGGDLFDHFEQQGRVFFLVGDVSGKGVAAALFMARAKTVFDAIATRERDPGAVLGRLNSTLCQQNDAGMFVTAVCGTFDLKTRVVTFATAGHEPPILVDAEGCSRALDTEGGRVLGVIDLDHYPVSTHTLAAGDALVMYTDGVSEAQDPGGDFFGAERLLAATSRSAGSAARITAGVLDSVKTFASTAPQSDDITILTLKIG